MLLNAGLSMNDVNTSLPKDPDEALNASPVLPVSTTVITLKQARERAGLHPVALAAMLKIPVKRLEALEAGRFDELPDMTFARALALSVCRALKVDPQPILANFPASNEVRLNDIERSLNAPLPRRTVAMPSSAKPSEPSKLSWPMAAAVFMAVVALMLWFFLPTREEPATVSLLSPVMTAEPVSIPEPALDPVSEEAVPQEVLRLEAPSAPSGMAIEAPGPAVPAPVSATPVDAQNGFAMTARETSWVQVTGASGRVLLQRSLQPGETVVLSTDFPLSVVVGRADEVVVSLRGTAFNMAPHTRNNVARFEVR